MDQCYHFENECHIHMQYPFILSERILSVQSHAQGISPHRHGVPRGSYVLQHLGAYCVQSGCHLYKLTQLLRLSHTTIAA